MRTSILIFFLIHSSITTFSQNTIFVGTKSYPATSTWSLLKKGEFHSYGFGAVLEVTFAKSPNAGYLMLSTGGVFFEEQSIGGAVLIYLVSGEVITLNNRLFKDFSDKQTTVIYSVSPSQINKLKQSNISQIRYSIVDSFGKSGFTAQNRYNKSYQPGVYDEGTYDTSSEIQELF